MNIKPLRDKILIEPVMPEDKTKSGIIIPDTGDKEKPEKGKVVSVGEGKVLENGTIMLPVVKEGDIVLFTKYGPSEIELEKKKYLIASDSDILAIIE